METTLEPEVEQVTLSLRRDVLRQLDEQRRGAGRSREEEVARLLEEREAKRRAAWGRLTKLMDETGERCEAAGITEKQILNEVS